MVVALFRLGGFVWRVFWCDGFSLVLIAKQDLFFWCVYLGIL